MFCTHCGTKFPEGTTECKACTVVEVKENAPPAGITVTLPPVKLPDKSQFASFLNFDTMITPAIMKAIYVIGFVAIFIAMLVMMFRGDGASGFFLGLIAGIVGLVLFRILCEQRILFFSIHERLLEIRDKKE